MYSLKSILLLVSLLGFINLTAQSNISKSKSPSWVQKIDYSKDSLYRDLGSSQYLLIDFQDNIPSKEQHIHFAIKMFNTEGIQEHSNVEVNFDPSYEKITFNYIHIIRDGAVIDKLATAKIKSLQRETEMDRALYDGSISAVINLTDIRKDDILDYAFTRKGFNPIKKGNYCKVFYQEYGVAATHMYTRILSPKKLKLNFKKYNKADDFIHSTTNGLNEYIWESKGLSYTLYDSNIPSWYDAQKHVSVSSFTSWSDVVEWALPLYEYSTAPAALLNKIKQNSSKEDHPTECIKQVQDEVRYLGFESGIAAYKPNPPSKVYKNRYGDCKDKSLLLVATLKELGIDAYPMLVNTSYGPDLENWLPSYNAFDHCVVQYNIDNKDYYVDPTINDQGGNYKNISFPDYKYGLIIKEGESQLTKIKTDTENSVSIKELLKLDSVGGECIIDISSTYKGSRADRMRSYFSSNSMEEITQNYLNFYSELYSGIKSMKTIEIIDSTKNSKNEFIILESYKVADFWTVDADEKFYQFETSPISIYEEINFPKSADRTMPFHLGVRSFFTQKTEIIMPSTWDIEKDRVMINNKYFTYTYSNRNEGNRIFIDHYYELKKEHVTSDLFGQFQKDIDKINDNLNYLVSYDKNLESSGISALSLFILLIGLLSGIFLAIYIYKNYNPERLSPHSDKQIGSWMILPLIGLIVSPFITIYQLVSMELLDTAMWNSIATLDGAMMIISYGAFILNILYNMWYIVFNVILIVLFYQKRTSVPKLMILFYIISFTIPILDTLFWGYIWADVQNSGISNILVDQTSPFIGLILWGTYFYISQEVKDTFTKYYKQSAQETSINSSI